MTETWDAYNKDFEIIDNLILYRGEPIPEGIFHLVCDIAVRHEDGEYLLMQRDLAKHFGGMWELTAGGSALRGENPFQCAKRELFEETGIASDNLAEIGKVISHDNHSIYVEFLCVTDIDKESIKLQKGETQDFKWVTKNELMHMNKENLVTERMQKFLDDLRKN